MSGWILKEAKCIKQIFSSIISNGKTVVSQGNMRNKYRESGWQERMDIIKLTNAEIL